MMMMMMMTMMMMRGQESGMRVLTSLMKPAFCVQFSATCGHKQQQQQQQRCPAVKECPLTLLPIFLVIFVIWKS